MGEEQRRFPRAQASIEAQCRPLGGFSELWRTVRTLDLSATGMRVCSEEPFEFWTTLTIRLQVPGSREPLEFRGRIARSTALPSGETETGVEFVDLNPEQQMQLDKLVRFLTPRA